MRRFKLYLVVVLSCMFLLSCESKKVGEEVSLRITDPQVTVDKQIQENLSEKDYLIREYKESNYLAGYDEVHGRLLEEAKVFYKNRFDSIFTLQYFYFINFKLTNYGYQQAEKFNYSFEDIQVKHPELISLNDVDFSAYMDGFNALSNVDSTYDYESQFVDKMKLEDFIYEVPSMSLGIYYFDSSLVPLGYVGYQENYYEIAHELYKKSDYSSYTDYREKDLLKLKDKYNEEFRFYGNFEWKPIYGLNELGYLHHVDLYVPVRNPQIKFDMRLGKDKYLSSIYINLFADHIDEMLIKHGLDSKISYLIHDENSDKVPRDTSQLVIDRSLLSNLTSNMNLSFYMAIGKSELEDKELHFTIFDFMRDVYEPIDGDTILTDFYIHLASDEDQQILDKLGKDLGRSEIYTERTKGMAAWGDQWERRRNGSDFFKYLDNFTEQGDYIYSFGSGPRENMTWEDIENRRQYRDN